MLTYKERKERTQLARAQIVSFLKGSSKKVIVSIDGLSHRDVGVVMNGGVLGQMGLLFRYTLSLFLTILPFMGLKIALYRWMGMNIGKNVYIAPIVYLDISHPKLITIEDDVIIGIGSAIAVHERNMQMLTLAPVHIGKGVSLGGKCLIRCGSRIADGVQVPTQITVRGFYQGDEL